MGEKIKVGELTTQPDGWTYDFWLESKWRRCYVDNGTIQSGGWEVGQAIKEERVLAIVHLDNVFKPCYFEPQFITQWS